MNKYLLYIFIILSFLLTACTETKEIDEELELNTYELQTNTFQNFYDINYTLTFDQSGTYEITLSYNAKDEFIAQGLQLNFYITVTEFYENAKLDEVYEISSNHSNTFTHTFEREANPLLKHAYISAFNLELQSGRVLSTKTYELSNYEYPVLIDGSYSTGIPIENLALNLENYAAYMELLSSIDRVDANQIMMSMTQLTQIQQGEQIYTESTTSDTYVQLEPFYLATHADGVSNYIHAFENDMYITFQTDSYNRLENKYIVNPVLLTADNVDEMLNSLGPIGGNEVSSDFMYNPESMRFDKVFNGYTIRAYLKDFVPVDTYNDLVYTYESLGLGSSVLEKSIVTLTLTYTDDIYTLQVAMQFDFEEPIIQTIRSIMTYRINYKSFTPKNIMDSDLIIMPASQMENVIFETDPFAGVVIPKTPAPDYFKVYLEAGQYVMVPQNEYVSIDILDSNGMIADQFFTYQVDSTGSFSNTFFIEANGYYYFVAHSYYPLDSYGFNIIKIDHPANITSPKTLVYGDNTVEVSGQYDLDYFVFEAPEDMYLEVTSTQNNLRYIQNVNNLKDYLENTNLFEFGIPRNWIYVTMGTNHIYFNNDSGFNDTIHVQPYGQLLHRTDDLETMSSITNAFLDKPLLLGPFMDPAHLKLEAEHAIYTFSYQSSNDILKPRIQLINALNGITEKYVYFDKGNTYDIILDAKTYYIQLDSGNNVEYNIKVDINRIEDDIIIESLGIIESYDVSMDQIPYVSGQIININHKRMHRFTLDTPTMIVVGIGNIGHSLYDSSGKLLTFYHLNYNFNRVLYNLPPGTYDLVPFLKDPSQIFVNYQLNVATLSSSIELDTDIFNPFIYDPNVTVMDFETNHHNDYEVILLNVTETTTYYVSANKSIYIYDENFVRINSTSSNVSKYITLEEGTYYFVSSIYPMGNLRLMLIPQND